MTRLSCSALNCVNNMSGACTASIIGISGNTAHSKVETQCETFAPRVLSNAIKNAFNTNYLGVTAQVFNSQHEIGHTIRCNVVNCTYNMGNTCTSTDIQVYGPDAINTEGTDCETFFKK